ncbi:hypothetical protein L2E82_14386 [Cichorium intybus]|uniref:Uncharacterized protein n=1 Tax=Cichorium intybus TaxID=13427 RepID=A0ACB9EZA6_CICIN|nr:hypothetical protein L2E82_14386 [Cichorium intybus]
MSLKLENVESEYSESSVTIKQYEVKRNNLRSDFEDDVEDLMKAKVEAEEALRDKMLESQSLKQQMGALQEAVEKSNKEILFTKDKHEKEKESTNWRSLMTGKDVMIRTFKLELKMVRGGYSELEQRVLVIESEKVNLQKELILEEQRSISDLAAQVTAVSSSSLYQFSDSRICIEGSIEVKKKKNGSDMVDRSNSEEGGEQLCDSCVGVCHKQNGIATTKPINSRNTRGKLKISKLEEANFAATDNSDDSTLILTEGDTTKTLAMSVLSIVGQDYYGVFPLKGKLLNVREPSPKQ